MAKFGIYASVLFLSFLGLSCRADPLTNEEYDELEELLDKPSMTESKRIIMGNQQKMILGLTEMLQFMANVMESTLVNEQTLYREVEPILSVYKQVIAADGTRQSSPRILEIIEEMDRAERGRDPIKKRFQIMENCRKLCLETRSTVFERLVRRKTQNPVLVTTYISFVNLFYLNYGFAIDVGFLASLQIFYVLTETTFNPDVFDILYMATMLEGLNIAAKRKFYYIKDEDLLDLLPRIQKAAEYAYGRSYDNMWETAPVTTQERFRVYHLLHTIAQNFAGPLQELKCFNAICEPDGSANGANE